MSTQSLKTALPKEWYDIIKPHLSDESETVLDNSLNYYKINARTLFRQFYMISPDKVNVIFYTAFKLENFIGIGPAELNGVVPKGQTIRAIQKALIKHYGKISSPYHSTLTSWVKSGVLFINKLWVPTIPTIGWYALNMAIIKALFSFPKRRVWVSTKSNFSRFEKIRPLRRIIVIFFTGFQTLGREENSWIFKEINRKLKQVQLPQIDFTNLY